VEKLISQLQADPACRWAKVIDTELPEDKNMVAFSMWYFWTEPQAALPDAGEKADYGVGSNWEACEYFFGGMRRRREERFEGKPYACKCKRTPHCRLKTDDRGEMLTTDGHE
jgi:hypothetical protein